MFMSGLSLFNVLFQLCFFSFSWAGPMANISHTTIISVNQEDFPQEPLFFNPDLINQIWTYDRKLIDRSLTIRLFTNRHKTRPIKFSRSASKYELEDYDLNLPTVFVFHGWMSGYSNDGWMDDYKDTVLRQMNDSVNVMLVDWSPLSKSPNYLLPAASVREIGHSVAEMAIDFQLDAKRIVCVGHSLGAHVCGGFGEKMNENKHSISQIWGLDPARPGFTKEGVQFRLDKSHARLVQILHTDGAFLGLGLATQTGHYDYYLNGGELQPGCPITPVSYQISQASCNHRRATEFMSTDQDNECHLIAYQCDSYEKFQQGECADCSPDGSLCRKLTNFEPALFDHPASNREEILPDFETRFYLNTGDEKPYCVFHYQISFVTSPDTVSNEGSVHIQLIGELRDSNEIQVSRTMGTDFEPSSRYSSLYTSRKPLGKVQMARVTFHPNGFGRLLYLLMNRPFNVVTLHVRFMSHPDAKVRDELSVKLCNPDMESAMQSGRTGITTDFYICS